MSAAPIFDPPPPTRIRPIGDDETDSRAVAGSLTSVQATGSNVTPLPKRQALGIDQIIRDMTNAYLDAIEPSHSNWNHRPEPTQDEIAEELLAQVNLRIDMLNLSKKGLERILRLKSLHPSQVARILMRRHHVVRIAVSGFAQAMLAFYAVDGPDEGTYVVDDDALVALMDLYRDAIPIAVKSEVLAYLRRQAPIVQQCTDQDLVPANNGILNYRTKELLPFTPDIVFLRKSRTDCDPGATSPVIVNSDGTTWEVEDWMAGLSDHEDVVHALWQVLGAILRPYVAWDQGAFPYGTAGNNGKGTYCALARELVGGTVASVSLAALGQDFRLEPLLRGGPIIVDENAVGGYIDDSSALKAIITGDPISVNRKGKEPITMVHRGFMIQCLNDFPKFRDRSESMLRRWVVIPFDKTFTGMTRLEIKGDYLRRPEVLRYVMRRVLLDMPNYYRIDQPAAGRAILTEIAENNDPVRQYWTEFEEVFAWDLLPYRFLYDLYKAWSAKANPSGTLISLQAFSRELRQVIASSSTWASHEDPRTAIRSANRMDRPEMLTLSYDLKAWMEEGYTGKDPRRMCTPTTASKYRGLLRRSAATADD
jgi:putative DNA primase/helicase